VLAAHVKLPFCRARSITATMRLMPSVTWLQLNVAPLMLAMSSPTRSGAPAPLPTNC
jgi:hypothetical protein